MSVAAPSDVPNGLPSCQRGTHDLAVERGDDELVSLLQGHGVG
jgi:hypothetical protein